ncbi:hypothetical protein L9F63_005849 [Diploptera punctata]|uniref:aralkylamine N-acetyltransferase n=1 Tax=Diploptera punctata TaxID=6984 RepID=A0AAD7ZC43_DIPPU|nr:hypothetical protein L9F63_005849 [Diploptera punctata]
MGDIYGYEIRRATSKDNDNILDLMRKNFFRDEPLNIAVGLLENTDNCPELEQFCLETLQDELSLVAATPSGEIVGACLNGMHEDGHLEEMEAEANSCPNPKFRKILQLLAFLERRANVFSKFPGIKKLLEIRIVAVANDWRGKGIATALLERTRQLAPGLGFTLIKVDCTSHFSARAMAKLNAECIFSMKYEDYCSPDSGEPVFRPDPPHTGVETYVQIASPNNRGINGIIMNAQQKKKEADILDR